MFRPDFGGGSRRRISAGGVVPAPVMAGGAGGGRDRDERQSEDEPHGHRVAIDDRRVVVGTVRPTKKTRHLLGRVSYRIGRIFWRSTITIFAESV